MLKTILYIFAYGFCLFFVLKFIIEGNFYIPEIQHKYFIIISLIFLVLGFILNALTWYSVINLEKNLIKKSDAIISVGLSIFGKYLPGKIWMILGRAKYISNWYKIPLSQLIILSLDTQIITILVGLFLGGFGLLLSGLDGYGMLILLGGVGLTLFLSVDFFHTLLGSILNFFKLKSFKVRRLNFLEILKVFPFAILSWGFWSLGFYFLSVSIYGTELSTSTMGLIFSLASVIGVVSVFSPGGLGVREGVLLAYLTFINWEKSDAISLVIVSRFWFLFGECFIFFLALLFFHLFHHGKSK